MTTIPQNPTGFNFVGLPLFAWAASRNPTVKASTIQGRRLQSRFPGIPCPTASLIAELAFGQVYHG